jgi:hypothetical protein
MAYSQILTAAIETQVYDVLHSLLLKIASDYDLDHGVLVERYLISGREGSPPPQYIYKRTEGDIPDAPVKAPRKAKVRVSKKDSDSEEEVAPKRARKTKPKSDAEDDREGKCTSLTAKGTLCKNNAFGGGCTCRVHTPKDGKATKEPKEKKKAKGGKSKKGEPEHSHKMDELAASDCELCETHGNPLRGEQEFELEDEKEVLAKLEDSDSEEAEAAVDREYQSRKAALEDEEEMSEEELQALADELEEAVDSDSEYHPESEEELD